MPVNQGVLGSSPRGGAMRMRQLHEGVTAFFVSCGCDVKKRC
jgi:hypothetical protein